MNRRTEYKIIFVAALGLVSTLVGFAAYYSGYYDSIPVTTVAVFVLIIGTILFAKDLLNMIDSE